jgi:hypothetical protein
MIKSTNPIALQVGGIYPNPAISFVNTTITSPTKESGVMIFTDALGRNVGQQNVELETGTNLIRLNVSKFVAGVYNLSLIVNGNKLTVGQIIKK